MSETRPVIDVAEIDAQRAAGWPDFHPEDYCHECGRRNPVWSTDLWNATRGDDYVTIRCPSCFVFAWERIAGVRICWELRADPQSGAIRRGEVSPALITAPPQMEDPPDTSWVEMVKLRKFK